MSEATIGKVVTWVRAAQLRYRWGDMAASTFYDRLKKGRIPPAEYPFGPDTPYWCRAPRSDGRGSSAITSRC